MVAFLPCWDDLRTVEKIVKWFTVAGFVSLFFVGVFEVLAYMYGNRKDVLIAAQQISTERAQKQHQEIEDEKRDAQISDAVGQGRQARQEQARAEEELRKLRVAQSPRVIAAGQREAIMQELKKHRPGPISVMAVSDGEAAAYCEQIVQVILDSGWNIDTYIKSVPGLGKQGLVYEKLNPDDPTAYELAVVSALRVAHIPLTIEAGNDTLVVGFRIPAPK
jgi:hypothetical protein